MRKPWLVQRCQFSPSDRKGVDGILRLDYMGSAEFEFGAVPESLKRMRASNMELSITHSITHNDRPLVIIHKTAQLDQALYAIHEVRNGCPLKESSHFHILFEPNSPFKSLTERTDCWWDIGHDYLFSFNLAGMESLLEAINES